MPRPPSALQLFVPSYVELLMTGGDILELDSTNCYSQLQNFYLIMAENKLSVANPENVDASFAIEIVDVLAKKAAHFHKSLVHNIVEL